MSDNWTTIESDPGVFTELIEAIGVKDVQVEELWSLDLDSLQALKPVHGLIFLFKWRPETDARPVAHDAPVFFAQQVITNACATQAIISILFNCPQLDLGPELTNLKEVTQDFPPDMRGLALGNVESIRLAHNSFARPEPLVPDDDKDDDHEKEAFHFVGYVPVAGTLYELDGLKAGPIPLASVGDGDSWLAQVGPLIQQRIERYAASEIRFNLMALVRDKRASLQEAIAQARSALDALGTQQQDASAGGASSLQAEDLQQELHRLHDALDQECVRRKRWTDENVRRRHNYIPFIFNLLKTLGSRGQLQGLIDAASKAVGAA